MKLTLFTGPECHLCELAKKELAALTEEHINLQTKNIRDDSDLYHLYAMRIPVLKREDTSAELNWPFNHDDIRSLIK